MKVVTSAITPVGPGHPYGEIPPHPARDAEIRKGRLLPAAPATRCDHNDVPQASTSSGSEPFSRPSMSPPVHNEVVPASSYSGSNRFSRPPVRPHGIRASGKRRRSQESAMARKVKPKPLPSLPLSIPVKTRSLPTYSNGAEVEVGNFSLPLHSHSVYIFLAVPATRRGQYPN
jgi:hypothetical protein